ncbi:hypothetical protein SAMN05660691_03069 [Rheinheimera pacifica]|uniref:DUF2489 domain-containing protein n=1 Tax=Rheinheimera pacifica TaxID=173990 RepID=A0A1H6MXS5_9GAMM|nr:hypothetical protein [Rheinheimera pacifica]SEI04636.1 hypothetical protein SAMN05660691_03069 [Rheinheimera pacifica]
MVWMLLIGVLVLALLYILWQMELVGKTNKSLQAKLQQREQELLRMQQAVFQLAEQQKMLLEQRLSKLVLESRLSKQEMAAIQLICQLLPLVTRESCSKAVPAQQTIKLYLRQHKTLEFGQLELMMIKHSRLTALWQNNSLISYLQLCTVAVALAEETQAQLNSA